MIRHKTVHYGDFMAGTEGQMVDCGPDGISTLQRRMVEGIGGRSGERGCCRMFKLIVLPSVHCQRNTGSLN